MESQDNCIAVISEKQAGVLARGVVYNYIGDDLNLYPISAKDKLNRSKIRGNKDCDIPSDELTDNDIVYVMFASTMDERFSGKTISAVNDWFKQYGLNHFQAMVYSVYQYTDGARSITSLPQQSVFGLDYRIAAKELLDKGFLRQIERGVYEKTSKVLNPQNNEDLSIYFHRNDKDTWAMARLHYSLLKEIEDNPLWERENIPDIPLTEENMISLVKGYNPDWDCRFAPYYLGGWFYITRSGYWLKKFKYKKGDDGYYHITEHYTTEHTKGQNLLMQIIIEGYFEPRIMNERLRDLFKSQNNTIYENGR